MTNHAFVGIVYQVDANNMVVEVRDQNDNVVPGRLYIREKKAGVWSAWLGSGDAGSSSLTGDMFYGIIGTAPNASFVVNDKADASGSNLLTVRKSDGIIRGNGAVPPGMIMDFGGGAAPVGWLSCDGQTLTIASYQELFNAIGSTWGWNGSTTFNLPNLQSRYRRHRDGGSYSGGIGLLQTFQNASHAHSASGSSGAADLSHAHSGTTDSMNRSNPHSHGVSGGVNGATSQGGTGPSGPPASLTSPSTISINNTDINHEHTFTTSTAFLNHAHTVSVTVNADGGNETRPWSATVLTCIKT